MKVAGLIAIIAVISLVGVGFFKNQQTSPTPTSSRIASEIASPSTSEPQMTDFEASFVIYTNGTLRNFSDPRYHNLSEDIYLEANNPNIVRVKKAGVTWNDFFLTLPMKLTAECLTTGTGQTFCTGNTGTLKFYINGAKSDDALNQVIREGDKLLVTFGTESEEEIERQINSISSN